jgi:hypothetical protein
MYTLRRSKLWRTEARALVQAVHDDRPVWTVLNACAFPDALPPLPDRKSVGKSERVR